MAASSGSVAAIVLAAGLGRRLGGPKALLRIDGETFLARAASTAREAGIGRVVLVVPPGLQLGVSDETVVVNADADAGPAGSLRLGLGVVGDVEAALAWPVDHPRVLAATVVRVIDAWRRGGASAVVPTWRGRGGHPTLFAQAVFADLLALGAGEGARVVLHRHASNVLRVEVDDEGVVADVDTPEDLANLSPT